MIDMIITLIQMIAFWLFMLGCAAAILLFITYLYTNQKDKRSK